VRKKPELRRAAVTLATITAVWIAATLPMTVINCSSPGGPYAAGFSSWQLFMIISSVLVLPLILIAAPIVAYARVPVHSTGAGWRTVAIAFAILMIGAVSWLTAHPGRANCFP